MSVLADALLAVIFAPMAIFVGAQVLAAVREIWGWRS